MSEGSCVVNKRGGKERDLGCFLFWDCPQIIPVLHSVPSIPLRQRRPRGTRPSQTGRICLESCGTGEENET